MVLYLNLTSSTFQILEKCPSAFVTSEKRDKFPGTQWFHLDGHSDAWEALKAPWRVEENSGQFWPQEAADSKICHIFVISQRKSRRVRGQTENDCMGDPSVLRKLFPWKMWEFDRKFPGSVSSQEANKLTRTPSFLHMFDCTWVVSWVFL